MTDLLGQLTVFGVSVGIFVAIVLLVWVVHRRLLTFYLNKPAQQSHRQLIMIGVWVFAAVLAVLVMPVGETTRGQLLGFLGILLSATIALSSTTLVGNAMAGLMLKSLRNLRMGDYIRVGEHFGRISNMDLLHVEIQTEDRDLATLPNLYLVTNPVTVLDSTGTILHVSVSLGYDVPRQKVEAALLDAATAAGLEKPYVQIRELGDFSISYQVSGVLTKVEELLGTRRKLRATVVDALHAAGIEIVSPTHMVTRVLPNGAALRPAEIPVAAAEREDSGPDEVVFDKARKAEELEDMKSEYTDMSQSLLELERELKVAGTGDERRPLTLRKKKLEAEMLRAQKRIVETEAELKGEPG